MQLLAHRGYHANLAENTMEAFAAAVALGVDGIETDVRLSADGQPVIIHDRVTPHGRAVSELGHAEIEADVGHHVPLLHEVLDAFPGVLWNIEIKEPGVWPVAAPILKSFRDSRRMLVSSFRHEVVCLCADELAIECGLLMAARPLAIESVISACAGRPAIRTVVWDYNIVDGAVLRVVAAAGWNNYVYGAVTMAEHARSATLGLAGLITDYPQRVEHRR
jgi:glycerophosphoryl diester phosphodiesterase